MFIRRRSFMQGAAALGAASLMPMQAWAQQTSRDKTLIFAPFSDVSVLDPVFDGTLATCAHGYLVFDTLYGSDAQFRAQPQMAEGHTISDDGLAWDIKLRADLKFHDGSPVLAKDCVASIQRWIQKDFLGQTLAADVEEWSAADDQTIHVKLKKPFPALADALANPYAFACFIMPERLAKTPITTPVTEMVGSGPMKFVQEEFVSGSQLVYSKFSDYVPRSEAPSGTAGGKNIYFDRIEMHIIHDAATAYAALQSGEIDMWEIVPPELLPSIQADPSMRVQVSDPVGITGMLRFNTLQAPFDNPKIRQIVLSGINQEDFMRSVTADVPDAWKTCYSYFNCGLPHVNEIGAPLMSGPKDYDAIKKQLADAGYKGETIVVMRAIDLASIAPFGLVAADQLKKMGMNVDLQEMDFATLQKRRTIKGPPSEGGWHLFPTFASGNVLANPARNLYARGAGDKGWFGWYKNDQVEALVQQWLATSDDAEQTKIFDQIQEIEFADPPDAPLGKYYPWTAMTNKLGGLVHAQFSVFWNIKPV